MAPKRPQEEPQDGQGNRWKINRDVSVTDLVTIVLATAALFTAYSDLTNKIQILVTTNVAQAATDKRQDEEAQRTRDHIDAGLSKLNDKLDRLLERPAPSPIMVPQPPR
jgi:hypothetical protein